MREQVDLQVKVFGGNAVEYKLCGKQRASSFPWRIVVYVLYVLAGVSAASWQTLQARHNETAPSSSSSSSSSSSWLAIVAGGAALMGYALQQIIGSVIVEESVLVVPSLGVQLTRRSRNGATNKQFIDASDISAVVVNEGFVFSDVVYYMAFMVKSREKMVVAFEHFQPRIVILQEIFGHVKHALFPDEAAMHLPKL